MSDAEQLWGELRSELHKTPLDDERLTQLATLVAQLEQVDEIQGRMAHAWVQRSLTNLGASLCKRYTDIYWLEQWRRTIS